MINRLLSRLPVRIQQVEPRCTDALAVQPGQKLCQREKLLPEFRRAIPEVTVMLLAGDQGMAIDIRLDREEAQKIRGFMDDVGSRLPLGNSAKDAIVIQSQDWLP